MNVFQRTGQQPAQPFKRRRIGDRFADFSTGASAASSEGAPHVETQTRVAGSHRGAMAAEDAARRGTVLTSHADGREPTREHVLVIDDMAPNRTALGDLLEADYDVTLAASGEEGLSMARERQPDLILLDVLMPGLNGYEVLDRLKADPATSHIAVIFITGLDRPEDEARSLQRGGSDFISKPFNPDVVAARVALHLRLARHQRQLQRMANIDEITGIGNRRHFERCLAMEWRRALRAGHTLSVAMVDVDHFKPYNDLYGHGMGDRALRVVAQTLAAGMRRPGDVAARYGGEEFGLIITEAEPEGAIQLAEELCAAVRMLGIAHEASPSGPVVSVSIGVASAVAGRAMVPQALVELADQRLYRAKAAGRDRACGGESD